MDGDPREFEDRPKGATPSDDGLSASFLPYDDSRLWLQMPDARPDAPKKRRRARPTKPPRTARARRRAEDVEEPADVTSSMARPASWGSTTSRLRQPMPRWVARAGVVLAALVLPVTAIAMVRLSSSDAPPVIAPPGDPSGAPVVPALALEGFRAMDVTYQEVALTWEAPSVTESFVYTVYRDGVPFAQTSDPSFTDITVAPQSYYYYTVTATGSSGTLASTVQLLVAVPSASGALPTAPPPAPPAPVVVSTSSSAAPAPSPAPTYRASKEPGKVGTLLPPPPPPPPAT